MGSDRDRPNYWMWMVALFFILVLLHSMAFAEGMLTVGFNGSGTGTVKSSDNLIQCGTDCEESYPENKKVTLKASSGENSYFAGWSGDPCDGITKPNCSLTMDDDKNILAIFELNPTLQVLKSGDGKGTIKSSTVGIDCGPDCQENSAQFGFKKKITLKATMDSYSTFLGWEGFECQGITKPQCTLLMDQNKTVTAKLGLPDVSVSPSFYDFGDVKVKQSSSPTSFTLVNQGTGNLKLTRMEILGTDTKAFKMTGGSQKGLTISPGSQYQCSVTFSPTSIGVKTATLRITSNDPNESVIEIGLTGNGTDSILTESNAPIAASAAIQTFNLLGLATDLSGLSSIGNFIGSIKKIASNQGYSPHLYRNGSISLPLTCEEGGSVNLKITWDGPQLPTDPSQIMNLNMDMTFESCMQYGCSINGKVEISFEGPLIAPTKITLLVPELTYVNTYTGDDVTIKNLTITIAGFSMDILDDFLSGTITISGVVSGMVSGSEIDVECDQFKIDFNLSSGGTTIAISGKIKATCLGDWITITSKEPIFIPAGEDCPTAGEIIVTSGGCQVRIVISSDYQINVYFNETLIKTYNNCHEVMGLCCS
ncbi:MAG: choice-of-anchor D domain-containing protein [Syntrophaceae bacterium]|nr:choice-of-anchor D domain-containing protein [Syntrophaceae bacterium]